MYTEPILPGHALITGAASGIGLSIAQAFAAAGVSTLTLLDVNAEGLSAAAATISRPGLIIATHAIDCSSDSAVSALIGSLPRLDYAVNSAGLVQAMPTPLADTTTKDYDRTNEINARGLFFCLRAELVAMRKQDPIEVRPGLLQRGVIVNVASCASVVAIPGLSVYVASKHAVAGLTRSAAADHTKDGIRVNSVSPGYIDGPLNDRLTEGRPEMKESMAAQSLAGRMGRLEEVADLVVFLAGKGASFVFGQNLVADGGLSVV